MTRGSPIEVLRVFLAPGADLVRRSGGASRLFPRRIRRAAPLARRGGLRRHRRALPIPAGAGEQPNRHQHRHLARRVARRLFRLARLHRAFGAGDDPFRLRCDGVRQSCRFGLAARAQDRRRGGCRAGRMGNGEEFVSRPRTRHDRRRCSHGGARDSVSSRSNRCDRRWRADRLGAVARRAAASGSACAVRFICRALGRWSRSRAFSCC